MDTVNESDSINEELVRLETQDASLYKHLVDTLDELIYKSIYTKLEEEYCNKHDPIDEDQINRAIEGEMSDLKDFDTSVLSYGNDSNNDLDILEEYLQSMVKIRNQAVEQQIISDCYENNDIEIQLVDERDSLENKKSKEINQMCKFIDELKNIKESNKIKLGKIHDLKSRLNELKMIKNQIDNDDDFENVEQLKSKYKKIVGKNLMLGHFITDLIAALTSVNIATDENLLKILMECNDYSDYDLLYE